MNEDTLAERYERTMSRTEQITRAGYQVKVQWECEFDASKIIEQTPELLTHPIVLHSLRNTRGALYGGRTEAVCRHHKIDENETIQYCDVTGLYPYICKYYKFPIGRPIIHVGDMCKNIEACLQMEGLTYCTILPPKNLFHPVLPFRCNKKFLFCLCRTCVMEQNMRGECQRFSDAERAISDTWVIPEIKLAIAKGYKILEIHEVYEYQVTQYNQETGEGGLFAEYMNTFLKLIAEASGHPDWVRTPNDEDQCIESLRQSEGFLLDKDSIKFNAAKRGLSKLSLNSMSGKICENPRKKQTILISDPQELYRFLPTPGIEGTNLLFAGDSVMWLALRHAEESRVQNLT